MSGLTRSLEGLISGLWIGVDNGNEHDSTGVLCIYIKDIHGDPNFIVLLENVRIEVNLIYEEVLIKILDCQLRG